MPPIVIRNGFSPTLPPRRVCTGTLGPRQFAGKPPVCCACTVECAPDGELRVQLVFQDGRTRSLEPQAPASRDRMQSHPPRVVTPPLHAWIARWIRWRG